MIDYASLLLSRIELANANSFLKKIYFNCDWHLSKDIVPHDVNETLEFLIKSLFNYG